MLCSWGRNKQYETHQLDSEEGQLVKKYQTASDNDWKKVKTETFEYLAREYRSIKSIRWDFSW